MSEESTSSEAEEEPEAQGAEVEGEPEEEEEAPSGSLLGFILVPAVLVAMAIFIFYALMWLTSDRRTVTDYVVQLRSDDPKERWQAALDLLKTNYGSPDLVPVLIEIIDSPPEEQAFVHTSWDPRDMLRAPEDKQVNIRWYATYALSTVPLDTVQGERAYNKVVELVTDSDEGVRLYAVRGLARFGIAESAGTLARALEEDEWFGVRMAAAHSLGELAEVIEESEERETIVAALRRAHGEDANQDVRWNAAIALARYGDDTGRRTLDEMVNHSDAKVRSNARLAIVLLDRSAGRR